MPRRMGYVVIHEPSGARAEHRDGRDQPINERKAFAKLIETPEFKNWHRMETARRLGQKVFIPETKEQILARVDRMIEEGLRDGSILIEEGPEGVTICAGTLS